MAWVQPSLQSLKCALVPEEFFHILPRAGNRYPQITAQVASRAKIQLPEISLGWSQRGGNTIQLFSQPIFFPEIAYRNEHLCCFIFFYYDKIINLQFVVSNSQLGSYKANHLPLQKHEIRSSQFVLSQVSFLLKKVFQIGVRGLTAQSANQKPLLVPG